MKAAVKDETGTGKKGVDVSLGRLAKRKKRAARTRRQRKENPEATRWKGLLFDWEGVE